MQKYINSLLKSVVDDFMLVRQRAGRTPVYTTILNNIIKTFVEFDPYCCKIPIKSLNLLEIPHLAMFLATVKT